jgi:hypothetical protein
VAATVAVAGILLVHVNEVTSSGELTGQVDDTGSAASGGRNIRFHDNTYRLRSPDAKAFAWQGPAWDPTTWRQRFDHVHDGLSRRPAGRRPAIQSGRTATGERSAGIWEQR